MRKSSGFMTFIAIALCVFIAGNLIRSRKQESSCEHVYGAAVTVKNPTCEDEGAKKMECLICGAICAETIPSKGGHLYVDKAVAVSPTCKTEGVVQRQCLLCNNTTLERIPKSENHTFDLGVEVEDYMLYTCTLCGFTKQGEIHKHKDVEFDGKCDDCGMDYDVFADESAYTEVDVVDGEYVAGNWYRMYRPILETDDEMEIAWDVDYYPLSGEWVGSNAESTISFIIKDKRNEYANGYLQCAGIQNTATFNEMICYITDEYIDFYFKEGVYTCNFNGRATWEVTKDTTISFNSSNDGYIKRLQINE